MKQKTIWTPYLLIGLIISSLIFLNYSCGKTEYLTHADFEFINETGYEISYSRVHSYTLDTTFLFTVFPDSSHIEQLEGEWEKNPSIDDVGKGLLHDFNGGYVLVELDTVQSILYKYEEGCNNIENFEAEKLGTRHFQYTYTFTEDLLNDTLTDN